MDGGAGAGLLPVGRLASVIVLLVGSGAREHALARALHLDPSVTQLHAAPGNPGIGDLATLHAIDQNDGASVASLAALLLIEYLRGCSARARSKCQYVCGTVAGSKARSNAPGAYLRAPRITVM